MYFHSAVLSAVFLKEHLNGIGKIGVLLSLLGSTMLVIHAPRHELVSDFDDLLTRFSDPGNYISINDIRPNNYSSRTIADLGLVNSIDLPFFVRLV